MSDQNGHEEIIGDELYGLMAEFTGEVEVLEAVQAAHRAGYTRMDAYSPFPVEGLAEALPFDRTWVPPITLIGGIVGGFTGYGLQFWAMAIAYPFLNIGGRSPNSWPYFIPITYELTILFASFTALFGMLILNRLPQPYHPVFNVPAFARASQDRFFIAIEATDPQFDYAATRYFLEGLAPGKVYDVPS
jgi:hypothetical protein